MKVYKLTHRDGHTAYRAAQPNAHLSIHTTARESVALAIIVTIGATAALLIMSGYGK